jgi:uncharacterized membrane protein YoaK (UPF0700 family)
MKKDYYLEIKIKKGGKMLEKLKKTTPGELMTWMLSAFVAGIGLGALITNMVSGFSMWIFIIAGIIHLIMMLIIYSKK